MASLLKTGENARNRDRTIFHNYEIRKITIEEALKMFRKNNQVGVRTVIPVNLFYRWLLSLGYIRMEE